MLFFLQMAIFKKEKDREKRIRKSILGAIFIIITNCELPGYLNTFHHHSECILMPEVNTRDCADQIKPSQIN